MRVTETSKTLSTSDSKTLDDRFQKKKNEVVTPITTKTFYEPNIEVEQNFQKSQETPIEEKTVFGNMSNPISVTNEPKEDNERVIHGL